MIKVFRFVAMCAISVASVTLSIAWAQTYKQVDVSNTNAVFTELIGGPNLEGTSVGAWGDAAGNLHGFSLTAKGEFTPVVPPGSTSTTPNFINLQGVIVGGYLDSATPPVSHGFILEGGQYKTVDVPGAAGTALSSINDLGVIVGDTCSDPACGNTGNANITHGFVRLPSGDFKFFDPPGATSSAPSTISLLGAIVGSYTDNVGELNHGYLLWVGKYTTLDFPGATTGTFAGGGNFQNDIVGIYNFAANCTTDCNHAFLLHDGVYTSFDYPGGSLFTEATGINALGVIVGLFEDSSGNFHGFIRTP
jgi:uncharacterized membrane protein